MNRFAKIQQRFFERITKCCNPTMVTIEYIKVTSQGELSDFMGDNQREVETSFQLKCLYQRYTNQKQREKAGVTEEVELTIFISPLELEKKTGKFDFPEQVRSSYSGIAINIFGKHHEIESIKDLEPQQILGRDTCVALQLNLKNGKGNTDFN